MIRKEKNVTAGKNKVTIKEITPVEAIMIAGGDSSCESMLDVLLATCGLTEKIFISLKQKEIDALFEDFKELNSAFFKSCKSSDANSSNITDDAATPDDIKRHVCSLISAGHGQTAWHYGWSFLVIALSELDKARSNKLHDMTIAARASNLDEKDFKSFLKTLS